MLKLSRFTATEFYLFPQFVEKYNSANQVILLIFIWSSWRVLVSEESSSDYIFQFFKLIL